MDKCSHKILGLTRKRTGRYYNTQENPKSNGSTVAAIMSHKQRYDVAYGM